MIPLFLLLTLTPTWVDHPPETKEFFYFVGEAEEAKTKDEALERAWNSALIRVGLTEFPELTEISSESLETLLGSTYKRESVQNLELINWRGVKEAKELGSPFVKYDSKLGTFFAYRLLKWPKSDMLASRVEATKAFQAMKKRETIDTHPMPRSPEAMTQKEEEMLNILQKLSSVQKAITTKDQLIEKVVSQLRCGVTADDVISVLGQPDEENMTSLRYGTFFLEKRLFARQIEVVQPKLRFGERKYICNSN